VIIGIVLHAKSNACKNATEITSTVFITVLTHKVITSFVLHAESIVAKNKPLITSSVLHT